MIKTIGKRILAAFPGLRARYHKLKWDIENSWLARLLYHFHDVRHTSRYMKWKSDSRDYWELSAKLLFQYHKLEKGMSMPGDKRFFGLEAAQKILHFMEQWQRFGFPLDDRVYLGAVETLRAYRARLDLTPPKPEVMAELVPRINALLTEEVAQELVTPIPHMASECSAQLFRNLCLSRRSVRNFSSRPVEMEKVYRAVEMAQLSPSACNRQPAKIHMFTARGQIDNMLELQNGNRGFGHTIPLLLVMTADSKGFFDGSERNEPYVDIGLFTMSLLLALQSEGLGSCCLNWCVSPKADREAHRRGNIPENEKIIMYLAVGYAQAEAVVPRSPRRALESIVTVH